MDELTPGVLVAEAPLSFLGIPVGARMTALTLADGSLLLHSPIAIDSELEGSLCARGDVRFIVAPNRMHHLFVADAQRRFDDAQVWLAPGLREKRPDLVGHTLGDGVPIPGLDGQLSSVTLQGLPMLGELVFCHHASKTLLLSDYMFYYDQTAPHWRTRMFARADGVWRRPAVPRDVRYLLLRERAALKRSIRRVLEWDFERIVLAHGKNVETNGKAVFERENAWLLD